MSYHADILGQHILPPVMEDRYQHPQYGNQSKFSEVRKIDTEVQESSIIKREISKNEEEGCENIDEII